MKKKDEEYTDHEFNADLYWEFRGRDDMGDFLAEIIGAIVVLFLLASLLFI